MLMIYYLVLILVQFSFVTRVNTFARRAHWARRSAPREGRTRARTLLVMAFGADKASGTLGRLVVETDAPH